MAPNGSIYLGRSLRHIQDFSKSWWDQHIKLIHEMVHVWQRQNGMHVMARRILKPFATYDYILEPGKPFHKYTMEQQATIVEDYFRSLHGVTAVKNNEKKGRIVYPPAEYEAVIPWLKNRRTNAPQTPAKTAPPPPP